MLMDRGRKNTDLSSGADANSIRRMECNGMMRCMLIDMESLSKRNKCSWNIKSEREKNSMKSHNVAAQSTFSIHQLCSLCIY